MFANLLFRAPSCALCRVENDGVLCSGCLNALRQIFVQENQCCIKCTMPQKQKQICEKCQKNPPPFAHFWSSTHYFPPMPMLIHQWKHSKKIHLNKVLSQIMRENPPKWLSENHFDHILPMPISKKRLWQRGFHQVHELAENLQSCHQLPILPTQLVLRDFRVAQSAVKNTTRRENIQNVFEIQYDVRDKNILILDDICTTGSTLTELARALHEAGAMSVSAWVCSRVVRA